MARDPDTVAVDGSTEELLFQRYRLTPLGGASVAFDRRLIYVGSAPDCDLVLDDPTVSRTHARLEFDRTGYLVRDLASKNGTTIAGVRIHEAYLQHGMALRFGRAEVAFDLDEETVQVELARDERFGRLLGHSAQMREIFALLAKVARRDVSVLVEGESGTGKELVAEAVHGHSARRGLAMVIFDCSAVAPELIESELFGHVKGAFTGAIKTREGVFQQAHKGTLFLDEIGELPLDLQPKLLRALETGEFRPVGSNERRSADVRVIAATNRRLDDEIAAGNFRQDLYYRLAVVRVRLPALRQRPEDIPLLVQHFLTQAGAGEVGVGYETMRRLQRHAWRGNVRELRNYVERAVVLSEHGRLETRHLSGEDIQRAEELEARANDEPLAPDLDLPFKDAKARLLDVFERRYWRQRLVESQGNISEAARRGGIHRKSLEYLIKKLDLRAELDELA